MTSLNSVTTKTDGWEKKCRDWAEFRQSFEVHDLGAAHFMFCQEICTQFDYAYKYRCRGSDSIAKFEPID
jgi:hypothetical protein